MNYYFYIPKVLRFQVLLPPLDCRITLLNIEVQFSFLIIERTSGVCSLVRVSKFNLNLVSTKALHAFNLKCNDNIREIPNATTMQLSNVMQN